MSKKRSSGKSKNNNVSKKEKTNSNKSAVKKSDVIETTKSSLHGYNEKSQGKKISVNDKKTIIGVIVLIAAFIVVGTSVLSLVVSIVRSIVGVSIPLIAVLLCKSIIAPLNSFSWSSVNSNALSKSINASTTLTSPLM